MLVSCWTSKLLLNVQLHENVKNEVYSCADQNQKAACHYSWKPRRCQCIQYRSVVLCKMPYSATVSVSERWFTVYGLFYTGNIYSYMLTLANIQVCSTQFHSMAEAHSPGPQLPKGQSRELDKQHHCPNRYQQYPPLSTTKSRGTRHEAEIDVCQSSILRFFRSYTRQELLLLITCFKTRQFPSWMA